MKDENKKCILSIKYSILDSTSNNEKKVTKIKRVFVAKNKNSLLEKIQEFEDTLSKRPRKSYFSRKMEYVQHFLQSWRYTYNSMLRM